MSSAKEVQPSSSSVPAALPVMPPASDPSTPGPPSSTPPMATSNRTRSTTRPGQGDLSSRPLTPMLPDDDLDMSSGRREREVELASSCLLPELSLPGSTSYESYTTDDLVNTPPDLWDIFRPRSSYRPVTSDRPALIQADEAEDGRPPNKAHSPDTGRTLAVDYKGKGKERLVESESEAQGSVCSPGGEDGQSSSSHAYKPPLPALENSDLQSPSPLADSPTSLLPSSPYQQLLEQRRDQPAALDSGRPVQPSRAQTQPVVHRASHMSPNGSVGPYSTAVGGSGRSTPSRLMSRSRANSLLSFSPAGSVASTMGSTSGVGRKLDEIKDKLKLTKIGLFTKKRSGSEEDQVDGSLLPAPSPSSVDSRRRGLFGQRRRTIGTLDAPSTSMPTLPHLRQPSPLLNGSGSLLMARTPSPSTAHRPVSRTAHAPALRPIVTRAVTTASLSTPTYPSPTPFLLPAQSAPASPSARTAALPFLASSSNTPSLLSITRPSTPLPPKPADHFDRMLPREIKVLIFRTLLDIWIGAEDQDARKSRRWTGEVGGRRELIRISRVSKSWLSLVYDGELWPSLSVRPYANLPPIAGLPSPSPTRESPLPVAGSTVSIPTSTLLSIMSHAGPFIRSLDLRNLTILSSATMHALALAASPVALGNVRRSFEIAQDGLRGLGLDDKDGVTRLTRLDMSGCRSFSGYALHHLLAKSPFLMRLNLRAIPVVTNNTCTVLFQHCPLLISLDLSRCPNIDAFGVSLLTGRAPTQIGHLQGARPVCPRPMKELRLAGLKAIDDDLLVALAQGMPSLQILDLSGCKTLTDDHLLAFVTVPAPSTSDVVAVPVRTVAISSREIGRDPASSTVYYKRLTSLRHLNLSSCPHLTDVGLGHFAKTMPRLAYLEVANFGPRMRDEGLVRLLETTPEIRKVDLECASEITDVVLGALTPDVEDCGTGSKLEHLVLSYVARVTADGMLTLVRGCKHLRVLEADNTRVSDAVVKEFVRMAASRRSLKAEITVTDSRTVSKPVLTDLHQRLTRPRRGFRGFAALPFHYQDATVDPDIAWGPGRSEIDDTRVVLHSFWGWSLVDSVRLEIAKEKKRRAILAAAIASSGGDAGPSAPLSTMSGGRRLLGWRSSSGSGVVMLDGVQPGAGSGTGGATSPQTSPGGGGGITPATPGSIESLMDPRDPRAACSIM